MAKPKSANVNVNVNIKVPPDIHRMAKMQAAGIGISLRRYLLGAIKHFGDNGTVLSHWPK